MTTDIIARLRSVGGQGLDLSPGDLLCMEAADEIEKLQKSREQWWEKCTEYELDLIPNLQDQIATVRVLSDLYRVLTELYAGEINFSLTCFWDGGFTARLGDELNGFKGECNCYTITEALEFLRDQAILSYPKSEFAEKYSKPR